MKVTPLDVEVYGFISHYTRTHRAPPESIGMIARALRSNSGVIWKSVDRLSKLGYLERERRNRAPVIMQKPYDDILEGI